MTDTSVPRPAVRRHARLLRVGVLALVLAVGVFTVYAVALLLDPGRGPSQWVAAVMVVAVLVPLARPRADRLADRVAYGPAGDPHAPLAEFVRRLGDELALDDVLPELARTAAQVSHSPWGEVRLWMADGGEWRQTWPSGTGEETPAVSMSLRHAGEALGRLALGRGEGRRADTDDALDQLAGSAGVALANVRLTLELRRRLDEASELADQLRHSRQRLLDARESQRIQLQRQVQRLVLDRLSLVEFQLAAVEAGEAQALRSTMVETTAALEGLREVATGIYPPVLQQRGLAGAVQWHLDHEPAAPSVTIRTEGCVRPPALVEATAYFCCIALLDDSDTTSQARVTLVSVPTRLIVHLHLPQPPQPSTWQLARDRVESLGGRLRGTRVKGAHLTEIVLPTGESVADGGSGESRSS